MASQRLTIAKLAGLCGEKAFTKLASWAAARNTDDPKEWSLEQWPLSVRNEIDAFAEAVRAHGFKLPVCHFVEWSDLWSMGDIFVRWLSPYETTPVCVLGNRYEILAYKLPDEDRLARHLASAGPQDVPEYGIYISRLRESLRAWGDLAPQATIIVLRYVIGVSIDDREITRSLTERPKWLS